MSRLIDDLVDVSRISRGKLELQRREVMLHEVVRAAVEASRPLIDANGHRLTEAVIRVADQGIGISPEQLPHLFELFYQAESPGRQSSGGLGIGLALTRDLVRMHGGSIEAASEGVGRGSEFVVRLPVLVTAATVTAPESRAGAPATV